MKIHAANNISFNAKLVNVAQIGKLKDRNTKQYEAAFARFIKLNPKSLDEISVLDRIADTWYYDKFATNIYNLSYQIYKGKEYSNYGVYALTRQTDNFDKVNCNDILALTDMLELPNREIYLTHLQVNPEYIYDLTPQYKGLGSAVIDSFKRIYSKIRLISAPEKSVRNFYKKHGFKPIEGSSSKMVWEETSRP